MQPIAPAHNRRVPVLDGARTRGIYVAVLRP